MPSPRTYRSDDIDVRYDVTRCIHAARCVHGAPRVFDPNRKPWVDPSRASADEVAEVVRRCPTGALQFSRKDGGAEEQPESKNTIGIEPNGPIFVRGNLHLESPDGSVHRRETRVALCRCGLSQNKPFCDNSHLDTFEDEGAVGTHNPTPPSDDSVLHIILSDNGPILLRGPVTISGSCGPRTTTDKCALCRCGKSANKPFCDGTHKNVGFQA